jgi:hypothetical protein
MTYQHNSFPSDSEGNFDFSPGTDGQNVGHEEHGIKSQSEDELFQALLDGGEHWSEAERAMVVAAYEIGSTVHRDDTHRDLPYTYHLLRNANRISQYAHIYDAEVLAGEILHDAVEDHPEKLAGYSGMPVPDGEQQQRQLALDYIRDRFSVRVAVMVDGMTNPLPDAGGPEDYYQKIQAYVDHVAAAIRNTDVFFGKWADWSDNGVGIRHSNDMEPEQAAHFTYKYGQVLPVLEARYREDDIQAMLDPVAKANIERSFELARQRLTVPE